jgi:hypothetical protein
MDPCDANSNEGRQVYALRVLNVLGSKNFFLVEEEIDDTEWLTGLIQQTEQELPPPKPRKKKKR